MALPLRPNPGRSGTSDVELIGERLGCRAAGSGREPEPVQMHHHGGIRRVGRLAVEDIDVVDGGPPLSQPRRRPREAPPGATVALADVLRLAIARPFSGVLMKDCRLSSCGLLIGPC